MNEWVGRSVEIANSQGYLDKLSQIYPSTPLPRRPLNGQVKKDIISLHESSEAKELVKLLLKLTKYGHPFPIEHPYASIFRQKPKLIQQNPKTFEKLGEIILSMSVEDVIRGCERPIDINRVMGQAFHNWLRQYFPKHGIPILPERQFNSYNGRAFFDGKNARILNYVNQRLKLSLERGRDFLFKVGNKFVIGEARFLSTSGGSQTRDIIETREFIRSMKGQIIAVGVLDGIVWFNRRYVRLLSELKEDEPALTVLLLKDFLESLR